MRFIKTRRWWLIPFPKVSECVFILTHICLLKAAVAVNWANEMAIDERKKKNFAVEIKLLDNLLPLVSRCKSHKVWNNSNGNFHCLFPHGSYPTRREKYKKLHSRKKKNKNIFKRMREFVIFFSMWIKNCWKKRIDNSWRI